jgi:uncharacterized membrane protein
VVAASINLGMGLNAFLAGAFLHWGESWGSAWFHDSPDYTARDMAFVLGGVLTTFGVVLMVLGGRLIAREHTRAAAR